MHNARWSRGPAVALALCIAAAAAPSLASSVNYYYDANGRLIASTRGTFMNQWYGLDNANNRSSLNTGHQGVPGNNLLQPNQAIVAYQSVVSPDGRFSLVLQGDGNAVLYDNNHTSLWSSGTSGKQSSMLFMGGDGNLVIIDAYYNPIWQSGTSGNSNAVLKVQSDGNVVIYNTGNNSIWQTNTCCH